MRQNSLICLSRGTFGGLFQHCENQHCGQRSQDDYVFPSLQIQTGNAEHAGATPLQRPRPIRGITERITGYRTKKKSVQGNAERAGKGTIYFE